MFDKAKIEEAIRTEYISADKGDGTTILASLDSGLTFICAWPRTINSVDVHFAAVEKFCKKYPELGPASAYTPGMVRGGFVWVKNNDTDR